MPKYVDVSFSAWSNISYGDTHSFDTGYEEDDWDELSDYEKHVVVDEIATNYIMDDIEWSWLGDVD